jgi:hypothetical protein
MIVHACSSNLMVPKIQLEHPLTIENFVDAIILVKLLLPLPNFEIHGSVFNDGNPVIT